MSTALLVLRVVSGTAPDRARSAEARATKVLAPLLHAKGDKVPDNLTFVRNAYDLAEIKDIPG
jgi:hypothetical protein